ncbi:MAG: 50S ribosomal protein L24 [Aquificae bacterium]|nr:50S ribosomal protein L24 [Aquificota bacterium]
MIKTRIKKGDTVIVIAGKEKGKIGKVKQILRDSENTRVVVENINIGKKHLKHIEGVQEGGIVNIERPIHISNVAYYDEKTGKRVKIGFRYKEEGEKVIKERFNKKTGETIDIVWEKPKKARGSK